MQQSSSKPISLKELAQHLELSQSTVSRNVNGGGTAHRIAKETQERVLHAAAMYGYSANSVARSLRQKRTYTIGVIVPEISEGYSTAVLGGIEDALMKDGFFYFVVSHRHRAELLKAYFAARSGGGLVLVAGYKIRIPGGKYRDPDVLYMTGEQNARSNEDFTDQAELVMEVVSPDDPNRDYVRKRVDYALAGIPEYWIVDPLQARIVVLTLFDGAYVEHGTFVSGQIVTSNRFPGLSVAVDEVWKLRH